MELKNKVGVITGGSRGIGAEIARQLAREGCSLTLAARSPQELVQRVDEVHGLGGQALAHHADLREPSAAAELVAATMAKFGRLDFVIANAGNAKTGDFMELSDDDWQQGFALKFFGHVRLIRAAWPHLKAQHGSIVIIAGATARTPGATGILTGSVNSALLNLTKGLAVRGTTDGVQVNAINPVAVRTERHTERLRKIAQSLKITEAEAERHMIAENGITRIGEPQDIAGMVHFILGRGSLMQGSLIDMDGGKCKSI